MTQPAPTPTPTPAPPGDPAPAPTSPTPTAPAPADPPADPPLGPNGERALQTEREARTALEKQLRALGLGDLIGVDVSALKTLAQALGGKPSGETQTDLERLTSRLAEVEKTASDERQARLRIEIARDKSLTAEQAAWLQGSTQEELLASADRLLAAFPTGPAGSRTPAPDPSQGARGGQPGPDLQAQIAEARKAGDFKKAIALERSKLLTTTRPT